MVKVIAFDLFGTIFDLKDVPREELRAYAAHLRQPWSPLTFPESWENLPPFPDVREGLELLCRDFAVTTFSNCPIELQIKLISNNGLFFPAMFDLSLFKTFKPNKDAYEALISSYPAYSPSEILVVSANKTFGDIEGAREAGMQSILIRNGEPNTLIDLHRHLTGGIFHLPQT